jgi:hypothetical protein
MSLKPERDREKEIGRWDGGMLCIFLFLFLFLDFHLPL